MLLSGKMVNLINDVDIIGHDYGERKKSQAGLKPSSSQLGGVFTPKGHLAMSGDVLVVTPGACYWHGVNARDAAK